VEAGEITAKHILDLFPIEDSVVSLRMTGAQVREALENGVSQYPKQEGRFPQVSGIGFTFDPSKPPGSRILEVHLHPGGELLDPAGKYAVATRAYLAKGKDGYDVFTHAEEILIDEENGVFLPAMMRTYLEYHKYVADYMRAEIREKERKRAERNARRAAAAAAATAVTSAAESDVDKPRVRKLSGHSVAIQDGGDGDGHDADDDGEEADEAIKPSSVRFVPLKRSDSAIAGGKDEKPDPQSAITADNTAVNSRPMSAASLVSIGRCSTLDDRRPGLLRFPSRVIRFAQTLQKRTDNPANGADANDEEAQGIPSPSVVMLSDDDGEHPEHHLEFSSDGDALSSSEQASSPTRGGRASGIKMPRVNSLSMVMLIEPNVALAGSFDDSIAPKLEGRIRNASLPEQTP
jgi:hypothetical protein